jgi:hypothetical protein
MAACGGRRRKAALRRSALPFPSAALSEYGEPPLPAITGRSVPFSKADLQYSNQPEIRSVVHYRVSEAFLDPQ